jgi:hypothetical protein
MFSVEVNMLMFFGDSEDEKVNVNFGSVAVCGQ